jgi:hypothetical protein|tara:strand:+ start:753 stop:872 length:120 start_codon:yes stop_codon:yes gene_type:complete
MKYPNLFKAFNMYIDLPIKAFEISGSANHKQRIENLKKK